MFNKVESIKLKETIQFCGSNDPAIKDFSRNSEHDLETRVQKEVECLKVSKNLKFFEIKDGEKFVKYFGVEDGILPFLTTFFIMPKYRKNKENVFKFITSHLPKEFYAGLFNVNTRAIKFFELNGAVKITDIMWEEKPASIFKFGVI